MTIEWSPLAWDSDFFGTPIGSAALDGASAQDLHRLEGEALDQGIRCLYGTLDPADAQLTYLVQQHGWRFVEAATTFDLRTDEPPIAKPPDTDFRLGVPDDIPRVAHIVDQMAAWSRFAVDPRFGLEAAQRMQAAWLDRAARAETGQHSLMVAEIAGEIIAFIGRVHEPARVDAVGTTTRGSGAARHLIQTAREWAGDQALLGGPIAARNVAALRYVSHCNYRVRKVEYVYHRWLDEDQRGVG